MHEYTVCETPTFRELRVVLTHELPESVVHPAISSLEEKDGWCFLTHSVKEELEAVKESPVLSVRPEHRIP